MSLEKFRVVLFNQKKEEVVNFLRTYDINTPQVELGCKYLDFELTTFHMEKGVGKFVDMNIKDEQDTKKEHKKDVIEKEQLAEYIFYGANKERYLYFKEPSKTYGEEFAWTPLHYVCACEKTDMIRLMLERGADVQWKDVTGRTALDLCEFLKRDKATKILKQFIEKQNKK